MVVGIIIVIVVVAVGALVLANLSTTLASMNLTGSAASVVNSLFNQTWGAYGLLTVVPIILIAAAIIAIVSGLGRGRGR